MSVNLQKGQKVDLTKGNAGLKKIVVGLGWEPAQPVKKKGLFAKKEPVQDIDVDASVILCGADGKLINKQVIIAQNKLNLDVVYFGNLIHSSNCVTHMGDNLVGGGDGDSEQIKVNLADMPQSYERVVFVVNIYKGQERNQHFGIINNCYIRIIDGDNNTELCRYNLSENYDNMTGMVFGEVYRHKGDWKFNAIGQPNNDTGIAQTVSRYV